MKFNRITFYFKFFLTVIILFLIGFVLYYLRGPEGYYTEIVSIIKLYYIGIPIFLLFIFAICFSLVLVFRKHSIRNILLWNISIFVIFLISFNLASFPHLNRVSDYDRKPLLIKKENPSILEAAINTIDSYKDGILDYMRMHEMLKDKKLIGSGADPFADDFAFYYFVYSKPIEKRSYDHVLSENEFQALRDYQFEVFRAFPLSGRNYAYFLYTDMDNVTEIYLFLYNRFVFFIPRELAEPYF